MAQNKIAQLIRLENMSKCKNILSIGSQWCKLSKKINLFGVCASDKLFICNGCSGVVCINHVILRENMCMMCIKKAFYVATLKYLHIIPNSFEK